MKKDGNKQHAVSYPKGRSGEGVAKEVKVDQTVSIDYYIVLSPLIFNTILLRILDYIADLVDAVMELR